LHSRIHRLKPEYRNLVVSRSYAERKGNPAELLEQYGVFMQRVDCCSSIRVHS
jgi:hypothetical protein